MWYTLIGASSTILGMVITYLTFIKGRDREIRAAATRDALIDSQLKNIAEIMEKVEKSTGNQEERINKIENEQIRINESVKTAHKRIDNIIKNGRDD